MGLDELIQQARRTQLDDRLPPARDIRREGTRRRRMRTATISVAAAACAAVVAGAFSVLPNLGEQPDPAAGLTRSLVYSRPGLDSASSEAIGTFEWVDGCLLFDGDAAVMPAGSMLEDDQLTIVGGSATEIVPLGEEVTIGGTRFSLSMTDLVDQVLPPDQRSEFDRCVQAAGTQHWLRVN